MNNNKPFKWISEQDQQAELKKRKDTWKAGWSRDGYVLAGEGQFIYKGIPYLIKVLRYYTLGVGFTKMMRRATDSHAVVEYPEEVEPIVKLIKKVDGYSEFLYHDTLHSWNDMQTVEEQINECHQLAERDIDGIKNYVEKIDAKIAELEAGKEMIVKLMVENSN